MTCTEVITRGGAQIRLVVDSGEVHRGEADVVIAPSVSGGRLMAAAVKQRAVVGFLEDLLSVGRGVDAGERVVLAAEAGKRVVDLEDLRGKLVIGVARGSERYPFQRLSKFTLMAGDIVVYLTSGG